MFDHNLLFRIVEVEDLKKQVKLLRKGYAKMKKEARNKILDHKDNKVD